MQFSAPDANAPLVVALSGGVDSTVAAWLLEREGRSLVGLFMRNGIKLDPAEVVKKSCCSLGDARDARMVAASMGFPFQAVDLSEEFGTIIDYFVSEYGRGRTPNPCAVCNRDLKMGRLMDFADEFGAAGVATGHYARIDVRDGRVVLRRGVDENKDQSYQLFSVTEAHLARTVLPLGGYQKPEVRALAAEAGLRTSAKKDSQEVCFIPSNNYRELLAQRGAILHPGKIVDVYGKVLADHPGTEHFTIGQRRGLGVTTGKPIFVVDLLPEEGLVVVGGHEHGYAQYMDVEDLNWIGYDAPASFECTVQHRYHCKPEPCVVEVHEKGARVNFKDDVLAVTPGQGAAFYIGDQLVGGGWISRVKRSVDLPDAALEARLGG
ncbi:MAG: tRNA-specific 2-thiouridylase [Planctomycetota bacterium]|jgi:tRNA-specific 2-thiouridylase